MESILSIAFILLLIDSLKSIYSSIRQILSTQQVRDSLKGVSEITIPGEVDQATVDEICQIWKEAQKDGMWKNTLRVLQGPIEPEDESDVLKLGDRFIFGPFYRVTELTKN